MSPFFVLLTTVLSVFTLTAAASPDVWPPRASTLNWHNVSKVTFNDSAVDYAVADIVVTVSPPYIALTVVNDLSVSLTLHVLMDGVEHNVTAVGANSISAEVSLRLPATTAFYWFSHGANAAHIAAGELPLTAPDDIVNITVAANATSIVTTASPWYSLTMTDVVTQTVSTTPLILAAFADGQVRTPPANKFTLRFSFPKPDGAFRFHLTSLQRYGRSVQIIPPNNGSSYLPPPIMTLPFYHTNIVDRAPIPSAINSIAVGDELQVNGGFIVTEADRFECAFISATATVYSAAVSAQTPQRLTCTVPSFITRVMSAGDEVLIRLVYMPAAVTEFVMPYYMPQFALKPQTFILADPLQPIAVMTDWKVWATIGGFSVIGAVLCLGVCLTCKQRCNSRAYRNSVNLQQNSLPDHDYAALDEALLQDAIARSIAE